MNYLDRYIDNNIIREYATETNYGLELESQELSEHEQKNLLDVLFQHDEITKEWLSQRIQELIEERLPWVETSNNYSKGFKPLHDNNTGEISWVRAEIC